jgi:C4-dicarboxylate transporter
MATTFIVLSPLAAGCGRAAQLSIVHLPPGVNWRQGVAIISIIREAAIAFALLGSRAAAKGDSISVAGCQIAAVHDLP